MCVCVGGLDLIQQNPVVNIQPDFFLNYKLLIKYVIVFFFI